MSKSSLCLLSFSLSRIIPKPAGRPGILWTRAFSKVNRTGLSNGVTDSLELLFISMDSVVTDCSVFSLFGTGLLAFTLFTILGKVGIRLGVRPLGLGIAGGLGENCKSALLLLVLSALAASFELTVPSFCIRARDVSLLLRPVAVTPERLFWEFVLVLECRCLLRVLDRVDVFVDVVACLRSLLLAPVADTGMRVFV